MPIRSSGRDSSNQDYENFLHEQVPPFLFSPFKIMSISLFFQKLVQSFYFVFISSACRWGRNWYKSTVSPLSLRIRTYFSLYAYTTRNDKLIIFGALICSLLSSLWLPFSTVVYAKILTLFIHYLDSNASELKKLELGTEILRLCLLFITIGVISFITNFLQRFLWTMGSEHIMRNLRHAYFEQILSAPQAWIEQQDAGKLSSVLTNDFSSVQKGISTECGTFIRDLLSFVWSYSIALYYGLYLLLFQLPIVAFLLFIGWLFTLRMNAHAIAVRNHKAVLASFAEQSITNIKNIVAWRMQSEEKRSFSMQAEMVFQDAYSLTWYSSISSRLIDSLSTILFASTLLRGAYLIESGELVDGGQVFLIAYTVDLGTTNLNQVIRILSDIVKSSAAAEFLLDVLNMDFKKPVGSDHEFDIQASMPYRNTTFAIQFENVQFYYPSMADTLVLRDLNFCIPKGSKTALLGNSGAGKSTIFGLIMRQFDVTSGCIYMNGAPVFSSIPSYNYPKICIVSQQCILFNMSIRDNLLIGLDDSLKEKICTKDLEIVCQKAFILTMIQKLPKEFDTVVGESGKLLSGGQRQRLALARAFLQQPDILLLDEVTSALDSSSESEIQKSLQALPSSVTLIVIAHRLATVKDMDLLLVLENGHIIEQGTHAELLAKNGYYAKKVLSQLISTSDVRISTATPSESPSPSNYSDISLSDASSEVSVESDESRHIEQIGSLLHDPPTLRVSRGNIDFKGLFSKKGITKYIIQLFALIFDNYEKRISLFFGVLASMLIGILRPLFSVLVAELNSIFFSFSLDEAVQFSGYTILIGVALFLTGLAYIYLLELNAEWYAFILRERLFDAILQQDIPWFDSFALLEADDKKKGQDNENRFGKRFQRFSFKRQKIRKLRKGQESTGSLLNRLTGDIYEIQTLFGQAFADLLKNMFIFIISSMVAFYNGWLLAAAVFSVDGLLSLGTGFLESIFIRKIEKKIRIARDHSNNIALEAFQNIKAIRELHASQDFIRRYQASTLEICNQVHKKTRIASLRDAIANFSFYAAYGVAFSLGFRLISTGSLSFIQMNRAIYPITYCSYSLHNLLEVLSNFWKAFARVEAIFRILDRQPALFEQNVPYKVLFQQIQDQNIHIRNLHFSYPNRPPTFSGLTLTFPQGKFTALVGESGAGKSSIVSLLLKFYQSDGIFIGDTPLSHIDTDSLRQHIAWVPQEPQLLSRSIFHNITFGYPAESVTQEAVEEAAKKAFIHDWIVSLPQGYATLVGSHGSKLSGGQKQRLLLARCFLSQSLSSPTFLSSSPSILLLDEATSALDASSELAIQASLSTLRNDRTLIVIAHRLATIQDADLIHVLGQGGRLLESGTHHSLLAMRGAYADLVAKQSF